MKLVGSTSGAIAAAAVALVCGCSSTPVSGGAPRTAQSTRAVDSNVTGTTNLMSAKMAGPAPKVGKAHLANDDSDDENEVHREDGSHRGGGFGSGK